jgi:predicted ribosomally synthesized peptide with nif11-like leader
MSKENVIGFWTRVQQDPDLRRRLDSVPAGSREGIVAELVRVGAEEGFPFSAEEFGQTATLSGTELSEQDLSLVAGGLLSDRFTSRMVFEFPSFQVSLLPSLKPKGF